MATTDISRSLKEIVHFYNTRDVLPRCRAGDPGEGTTCWPAPESTANMNKSHVGHLGLSDAEEDALVSFMRTLTDGYTTFCRSKIAWLIVTSDMFSARPAGKMLRSNLKSAPL